MDPRLAGTDAGRYAPQSGMGGKGGGMGLQGMTPQQIQQLQAQSQPQTPSPEMERAFAGMNRDMTRERAQFNDTDYGRQKMAEFQQNAMNQRRPQNVMPMARMQGMMQGQPQTQSQLRGLAALQQPTAAPEQPYMGNYLK
jgi:hypothetical protein